MGTIAVVMMLGTMMMIVVVVTVTVTVRMMMMIVVMVKVMVALGSYDCVCCCHCPVLSCHAFWSHCSTPQFAKPETIRTVALESNDEAVMEAAVLRAREASCSRSEML